MDAVYEVLFPAIIESGNRIPAMSIAIREIVKSLFILMSFCLVEATTKLDIIVYRLVQNEYGNGTDFSFVKFLTVLMGGG